MKQLLVLGPGCAKCKKLAELTDQAAKDLNLDYELNKVEDINQISSFGIMSTPALVVDGEIKTTGRLPSLDEIKEMIK